MNNRFTVGKLEYKISLVKQQQDRLLGDMIRSLPEQFSYEPSIIEYCEEVLSPIALTFAAFTPDGSCLGCAAVKLVNENTIELIVIAVSAEAQGKGIGSALIDFVCKELKRLRRKFFLARTVGPSQKCLVLGGVFNFLEKKGFVMLGE